ncbi:MAG: ABC transporter permease [Chitinivibrionales bacterium]|nr:ABC transporter permease [Chitinivibrionales bacterium]
MSRLFAIALRNILRGRRRSILSVLAVAIGIFMIVLIRGNLDGLQKGVKQQITEAETGDVQVHRSGFLQSLEMMPLSLSLKLDDSLKRLIFQEKRVRAISGRILFAGMISDESREYSTTFFARAIDVSNELRVCPRLAENVTKGRLPRDSASEIVVSYQIAESMKLKLGSFVTLATASKEGVFNALDFTVVGITDVRLPTASKKIVYVPLQAAQELLLMPSEVTEIVIDIDDMRESHAVSAQCTALLNTAGVDAEAASWDEVADFFTTIFGIQNAVFGLISAIVFMLVVTGIANAMLMMVFERVREIGTLMAMGMRRRQIMALFLYEAAIMSCIGAVIGAGGGLIVITLLGKQGITFTVLGSISPATIYPSISGITLSLIMVGAIVGALISGSVPAWKASKLKPAEAIRSL